MIILCFLVLYPFIYFSKEEKILENAGIRYFEKNPNELPTGNRIKTIYLKKLYQEAYQKESLNIPYTNKLCSINNSWVKVKKTKSGYQYYTYLDCWPFSSKIDHEGPNITLNDSKEIKLEMGEEFTDPGVKSVVDNVDGKIDVSNVIIKNNVDTSKVGTYEISYTVKDKLDNKTVLKRKVKVVQTIYSTIKEELKDNTNFKGDPSNNYIRLSNMVFRVYGIDEKNNVILVSDEEVSYANHTKIDKWLEYYYNHLNEKTKKMIVETDYCNESLSEEKLSTTSCDSYNKERKVSVPSVSMINKAQEGNINFMKSYGFSWTANKKDDDSAYIVSRVIILDNSNLSYLSKNSLDNYGIRPIMTIKGSSLIIGGDGTHDNPYIFDDTTKAKVGDLINERYTGEYISIAGDLYRIIETEKDGTTRIMSEFTAGDDENVSCPANSDSDIITYDPKNITSVAYYINNRISAYINMDYFVKHKVTVPIYKDKIIYGEETDNKEYTIKLSAPNMYEMFSAMTKTGKMKPYWLINTSLAERITGVIKNNAPINEPISKFKKAYVRVVGYLKSGTTITNGDGTYQNPYSIK